MLEWLKKLLFDPPMTLKERKIAIQCTESTIGGKVFRLDGPATTQLIREFGFPTRQGNGPRLPN